MIIDISSIVGIDGAVFKFEGEIQFEEMSFQEAVLTSPVQVKGEIKNFGGEYVIIATLLAEFKLSCARCLKTFAKTIEVPMEETLNSEENSDYLKLVHYNLDLTEAVYTNLMVNLSNKYVCDVNCKGLCTICGANLNNGDCGCDREETDPRFEVLKNLLK